MKVAVRDGIALGLMLSMLAGSILFVRARTPAVVSHAAIAEEAPVPTQYLTRSFQEVYSPDGTKKLLMQRIMRSDATVSAYTLSVSDSSGANRRDIYEVQRSGGERIRLPANSWSPDNTFVYVFNEGPDGMKTLVFSADGKLFADGASYMDVSEVFRAALPDVALRDVTGWDDTSLLHVMTYAADATVGPSYRFDVWSRSFYRLSHR